MNDSTKLRKAAMDILRAQAKPENEPRYLLDREAFACAIAIALEHGWDLADAHHRAQAKERGDRAFSIQLKPEVMAGHVQKTGAYILAVIRRNMREGAQPGLLLSSHAGGR